MDNEFPSNSHRQRSSRPEKAEPVQKDVKRVTTSSAVRRKKPLGKRLVETFLGGDVRSVCGFVAMDVLIPSAKDMAADAIGQGIERMLFGDSRPSSRRNYSSRNSSAGNFTPYNRYSSNPTTPPLGHRGDARRDISRRSRSQHEFDEIILPSRAEAEEVINRLYDLIERYDMATVADLYNLVGVTPAYTDDKYGWVETKLQASVSRAGRDGYLLNLSRPEPLD